MCVICFSANESVDHLMIHCSFTRMVWKELIRDLNISQSWNSKNLDRCLKNWMQGAAAWKELPCYVCWEIWKLRNSILFEGSPKSVTREDGMKCGAGAVLKLNDSVTYNLKMNCGRETYTRGELLALWALLFFAKAKKVFQLQVSSDSQVIIDWCLEIKIDSRWPPLMGGKGGSKLFFQNFHMSSFNICTGL